MDARVANVVERIRSLPASDRRELICELLKDEDFLDEVEAAQREVMIIV